MTIGLAIHFRAIFAALFGGGDDGAVDAEIMIRVLIIGFGGDSLTRGGGIIAEGDIFFVQLQRIAAKPDVWPVGIECCIPIDLAVAIATTTPTLAVVLSRLSHMNSSNSYCR